MVGEGEREARQKTVWIEEALAAGDRDRLAQLAVSRGGLLSDEVSNCSHELPCPVATSTPAQG